MLMTEIATHIMIAIIITVFFENIFLIEK